MWAALLLAANLFNALWNAGKNVFSKSGKSDENTQAVETENRIGGLSAGATRTEQSEVERQLAANSQQTISRGNAVSNADSLRAGADEINSAIDGSNPHGSASDQLRGR